MNNTETKPARPIVYEGYSIIPREEKSWPEADRYGFWVVKDGLNAMPGAAWFHTVKDAIQGIKNLKLADGNARIFWYLMGNSGYTVVRKSQPDADFILTISEKSAMYTFTVKGFPTTANATVRVQTVGSEKRLSLSAEECLALSAALRASAELLLGKR